MEAVEFESRLARRTAERKRERNSIKACFVAIAAGAIVLSLASTSIGASQAVILLGSRTSVVQSFGTFDGVRDVILIQVSSSDDLVVIKTAVKGHLSDLTSVSYKIFISQTGSDGPHEPYASIKLTGARSLVCQPTDSYSPGGWSLPFLEWQTRDLAADGLWALVPSSGLPVVLPLQNWVAILGDPQVVSLSIATGHWQTPDPFQCYIGDLSVNGASVGIANAKRASGSLSELLSEL